MKLDVRYLAGLFDGRGKIYILGNGSVRASLRLPSRKILMTLKSRFGGTCYRHNYGKFDWRIQGRRVYAFLALILPHLRINQKMVEKLMLHKWSPQK